MVRKCSRAGVGSEGSNKFDRKIFRMAKRSNIKCRNYNLTRDNKVHKPYLAKFDKNGNKGRKHE